MAGPWSALESIPGLIAFPAVWRSLLGDNYEPFKNLCLQPSEKKRTSYPCPLETSCAYRIITQPDGSIAGHCQSDPITCPHISLTLEDVTPLELNWHKLGRALCKALSLESRPAELNLFHTRQIGSWAADAVPVILTIQTEVQDLLFTVGLLAAQLRQKFILLAPTSELVDASCKGVLANYGAALFPLDSIVTFTSHGTLLPVKLPGELFARFRPEPGDRMDEAVPRQVFAVVTAFDENYRCRKAPLYRVFMLYCAKGLSAARIAHECHCTIGLIFIRLRQLRKIFHRDPAELRQYSAQFEALDRSLSDSRARRIHRKSAIYGDDSEQTLAE